MTTKEAVEILERFIVISSSPTKHMEAIAIALRVLRNLEEEKIEKIIAERQGIVHEADIARAIIAGLTEVKDE